MGLRFERLSVLVVEDTLPMRKLMVSVLEALGFGKIYTAENGTQGFSIYRQYQPDIVLTDWLMKPTDGLDLVRLIRTHKHSKNKATPIILVTGYSALSRVIEARDSGVTEFLVKPFTANDLAKRLAYVINRPRDFVETPIYAGPDRRRKNKEDYAGPRRRDGDPAFESDSVLNLHDQDNGGSPSWTVGS